MTGSIKTRVILNPLLAAAILVGGCAHHGGMQREGSGAPESVPSMDGNPQPSGESPSALQSGQKGERLWLLGSHSASMATLSFLKGWMARANPKPKKILAEEYSAFFALAWSCFSEGEVQLKINQSPDRFLRETDKIDQAKLFKAAKARQNTKKLERLIDFWFEDKKFEDCTIPVSVFYVEESLNGNAQSIQIFETGLVRDVLKKALRSKDFHAAEPPYKTPALVPWNFTKLERILGIIQGDVVLLSSDFPILERIPKGIYSTKVRRLSRSNYDWESFAQYQEMGEKLAADLLEAYDHNHNGEEKR